MPAAEIAKRPTAGERKTVSARIRSGIVDALAKRVGLKAEQRLALLILPLIATSIAAGGRATEPDDDHPMAQFLERVDGLHPYRAMRWLEAENGGRSAWMEAQTHFSSDTGFRYEVVSEGGSEYIRTKVLRTVLEGEREIIEHGEADRSALVPENYSFQPNGLGPDGLAKILISPRRKERVLVAGAMFLRPDGGELVRLQGRLARNPSFWIKSVDIERRYSRINGVVLPVAMHSTAQLRLLGAASLRMTYTYTEVDGRAIAPVETD